MPIKKDKKCNVCGIELCAENWLFAAERYKHKSYICDGCRKISAATYATENAAAITKMNRVYRIGLRLDVMNHYGNKCELCGIDNINYLTIDHINNDGNMDRNIKKLGSGHNFYRYLIKNNYPKGHRVLCFNCNCSTSAMMSQNTNPEHKIWKLKLKATIIEAYGGECRFCKHTTPHHLTIDHIYGAAKTANDGRSSTRLYKYLVDNNFPTDNYQLLCYNCNCAKQYFKYVPEAFKDQLWAN